jgi:Domain of unknown function (DUF4388)
VPQELSEDLQVALFDLQRYLLDQIPPITAVEAVETLMDHPPELLMRQVHAWIVEQSRMQSAPISDFIFHALKKVFATGELKLLDRAAVLAYIDRLTPLALQMCPAEDREMLKTNLTAMRDSRVLASGTKVDLGAGGAAGGGTAAPAKNLDGEAAQTAKRFSLIIERLSRQVAQSKPTPQAVAQLVGLAAASASNERELNDYMMRVKPLAGEQKDDNLFKLLGQSLPAWNLPVAGGAQPTLSVKAMKKIVALAANPMEGAKRLRELLSAAVEQFNGGNLSAAISMLELAETAIVEKKVDPNTVERARAEAVENISGEQLRKCAESKTKRPLLIKVLSFFPTLTKDALFEQLRGEEKPERRRSLLGLLEAYAAEARERALDELDAELKRPPKEADTYYLRNLIYLLHRIPRESDDTARELDALTRASARGQNIYVIREAANALGLIKNEATVKLLTMRLAEMEATLLRSDTSSYSMEDMQKVLDRVTGSLSRIGTPAALKTLARHGMKANVLLGDTRARLSALAQHDLSFDEETMNVILKAIRDDLPSGLLGRFIPKKQASTVRLVEALSGTRSEAVEQLFRELAEKYADQDFGRAGAKYLADLAKPPAAAVQGASLAGELEFFGLPSVMQSLAEMRATGMLTVSTKQGQVAAKLVFVNGRFLNAQSGVLKGVDAVYQLLERPVSGAFAFVPHPQEHVKSPLVPTEVMPLLMEGIRRHDELNQACTVVPDEIMLKPTSVKPTPHDEESDASLIREVWVKASSGASVGAWESQMPADAFRVRRLIAHWMEQGALQPA